MKLISGTALALGGFLLGSAVIVGGLMIGAQHLSQKQGGNAASAGEKQKIGTAMEHQRPLVSPVSVQTPQTSAGVVRTEPAAQVVAAPASPALEPVELRPGVGAAQPRGSALPPAATVQASAGTPAITEDAASVSVGADKFPKGARGCTTYRSYDARTQTYRAFDGTTRSCRPEG